jgi:hypothetical protein
VRLQIDSGLRRDVFEMAVTVVLEEHVAAPHGSDEQILVAIIIDVSERSRHADAVRQGHAGLVRYVSEFPPPRFFQS